MSSTVDAKKLQADESTNKKTDNRQNTYIVLPITKVKDTQWYYAQLYNHHKLWT